MRTTLLTPISMSFRAINTMSSEKHGIVYFMYIVSKICFISIAYASVNLVINGSGNGLAPVRRQAITWTNAALSSIGLLGTSFNEIWIWFLSTPYKKIHLNCCLPKWRPFCLRLNVLRHLPWLKLKLHTLLNIAFLSPWLFIVLSR